MKRTALAVRDLVAGITRAFGLEGAWLAVAALSLSVGAFLVDPRAPWFVIGALALVAFFSLTRRST